MPQRKRYDLAGKTFAKLTVLSFAEIGKHGHSWWRCRCECGTERNFNGNTLVTGHTRSCGCGQGGRSGLYGSVKRTHGMSKTPIYTTWINIRHRCSNSSNQHYRIYGGRGIRVCDAWQDSFEAFFRDMGPTWKPGLTIERLDVNGHYEPGNCTWIPMSEQWRNRRSHGPKRASSDGTPARDS